MFSIVRALFNRRTNVDGDLVGRQNRRALNSALLDKTRKPEVLQENLSIKDFDRLLLEGDLTVCVCTGDDFSIRIDGKPKQRQQLVFSLNKGKLTIVRPETKALRYGKDVVVSIALPSLVGIECLGSGLTVVESMSEKHFEAGLTGSGELRISGQADRARLSVQGSGNLIARDFSVKKLHAELLGSGLLQAYASEEVTAELIGSGTITIDGKPTKVAKISSLGSGYLRIR